MADDPVATAANFPELQGPLPDDGSSMFCPGCGRLVGIAIRIAGLPVALDRDPSTGALIEARHVCERPR